jgi:inorganic pyrophosphatase
VIAVVHRNDDVEEKWVVAPTNMEFTADEIKRQTNFQEKYFDSEILL